MSLKVTLQRIVWIAFAVVVLRFVLQWGIAAGLPLPKISTIVYTLIFTLFSTFHASSVYGWRKGVIFLLICAAVSWCYEEAGVATGLVYGHYHYGSMLGPKLGEVPLLIPLAWFMMVYPSWIIAHVLMQGSGDPTSLPGGICRALIASTVMTSWDVVMDPGNAQAGLWTWEEGGPYFGVPFRNFFGWMLTTSTVYIIMMFVCRRAKTSSQHPIQPKMYMALPVILYGFVAFDKAFLATLPELHIVAVFGMCFISVLALFRLLLTRNPISLPPA
jgi:uncharacterized membrane protein